MFSVISSFRNFTMIEKNKKSSTVPGSKIEKLCLVMENNEEEMVPVFPNHNEEVLGRWTCRSKRHIKKKISVVYLLKVICSSRETCIEWLKNRGLIPKIIFCPTCNRKMKFEADDQAIDGYIWICQECLTDPPQFSVRHGSWLERKEAPLVDILLFTYLWSHGFTEDQIHKETNMPLNTIREWNAMYSTICDSLYQRSLSVEEDHADENTLVNKESSASIWQQRNKYKDPFLEFLKDADSI